MDLGAAIFMGLSWLGVLALSSYCFWKVFTTGGDEPKKGDG
jgi:hypothetical protein